VRRDPKAQHPSPSNVLIRGLGEIPWTMPSAYTLAEAQKKLPALVKASQSSPVAITKNKEVVGFFLSRARMESLLETIEVMDDKKAMKAIRDYEAGKTKFRPLSALDDDAS